MTTVRIVDRFDASVDAIAIPVLTDQDLGETGLPDVERSRVEAHLERISFDAKVGSVTSVPASSDDSFAEVFVFGLGAEADTDAVRRAAGSLGLATRRVERLAVSGPAAGLDGGLDAFVEGFLLGQYRFDRYRSKPNGERTEQLTLRSRSAESARRAEILVEAVSYARDLVNRPSLDKSPETIADEFAGAGADLGLSVEVHDEKAIADLGLGGLAGVAAGALRPPRLVIAEHSPDNATADLAFVGKGVVFDSGGLSLKPAKAMETMKSDISGAAAVLGAMQAIARLRIPSRVRAVVPLTENMPGGGAIRPGDVLRIRNGKTIEVLNTDAEGRLVLADGLALAAEQDPDLIVDVATLTGACHVALGDKIAGLWSNDDSALAWVEAAARAAGERVWPMPLPSDYRKDLDSDLADMKNIAQRYGGAIYAAHVLQEFVDSKPWVHIDIAGPALAPEAEHYITKGGTGFGVRTLVAVAEAGGKQA